MKEIRNCREDEKLHDGKIIAKNPNATVSVEQHIANGRTASQYISTVLLDADGEAKQNKASVESYGNMTDPETQALWNLFDKASVIRIAVIHPGNQPMIDCSSVKKAKAAGCGSTHAGWASHSYECLFTKSVPARMLCDETTWESRIPTKPELDSLIEVVKTIPYYAHGVATTYGFWQSGFAKYTAWTEMALKCLYQALELEDEVAANALVKIILLAKTIPMSNHA